jgi:hypothetical protein
MEGTRLHPVQDTKGIWRFDPAEVETSAAAKRRVPRTKACRVTSPLGFSECSSAGWIFTTSSSEFDSRPSACVNFTESGRLDSRTVNGVDSSTSSTRERRERIEDERAHVELMKTLR